MGTPIFLPHKTIQHKDIHYTSNYNKCDVDMNWQIQRFNWLNHSIG